MPVQTLSDVNAAFEAGQWHLQRFLKNAGTSHALQWADPTFASGQPAYDAHVGTAVTFTPAIAAKNDSIYMPGIRADQHRHLAGVTMWQNQGTYRGPASVVLFDLLGYYPLIDGDSTDTQEMDNTLTLPRYASGEGVSLVLVNHVAPAIQGGQGSMTYTNSDGVQQTVNLGVPNNGVNLVCSAANNSTGTITGPFNVALANGARGIRSLDSITYTTPPGGLHCAYLIKPLATVVLGDHLLATEKEFAAGGMPRIHDGAWLGWFDRVGGTASSVAWFGNFIFIWG